MLLRCFPLHLAKASTLVTVRPTIVPIFVPWVFPLFPWKPPCQCFPQLFGRAPASCEEGFNQLIKRTTLQFLDQQHQLGNILISASDQLIKNQTVWTTGRSESNCLFRWLPQEGFQWNLMQSTRIRKWNKQNLFNWKNHTTTVHCQIDSYYAQYWTKTILIHNVIDS